MELEGKVAAINGGTRGIGRAVAEAFLAEGAKVVITGRTTEKGERALAEMNAGDGAHFIQADGLVREDCERVVDGTVDRYGRIDILFNNAGGSKDNAPIAELTDEAMQYGLQVNLWSTFWCTRKALGYMIPQEWGRIINMSSVEGKMGKPGLGQYVVGKHAVNALTKTCAHEVGTLGITVNAVCPGAIETDMMTEEGPAAAESMGMSYEELLAWFARESATQRLNEVEDVAAVAVLLASDAGAGITGAQISIDGGTAPY
jgi:3-hydroxybutyrate dehydrogenase